MILPTVFSTILINFVQENLSFTFLFLALSTVLPEYIKEDIFEYVGLGETNIELPKKLFNL